MIVIPPRHYVVIENPVVRDGEGKVVYGKDSGEAKLAFSDLDFRFTQAPFPLYPGEVLKQVGFAKQLFYINKNHYQRVLQL